jgi:hypothetical protein
MPHSRSFKSPTNQFTDTTDAFDGRSESESTRLTSLYHQADELREQIALAEEEGQSTAGLGQQLAVVLADIADELEAS